MRTRSLFRYGLPLATLLSIGGGMLYRTASRNSTRTNSSTQVSPHSPVKSQRFSSASEAVNHLIKSHDPQIIAFGEFHNEFSQGFVSTSEHFANDIMPILPGNNFRDLIHEFIPADPIAYAELDIYKRTGRIDAENTPFLHRLTTGFDGRGALKLLEQSTATGINLHGCNLSFAQEEAMNNTITDTDSNGVIRIYMRRMGNKKMIIRDQTVKRAGALLRQRRKVALYTGLSHNDLHPTPRTEKTSFGRAFAADYEYLEIDLIPGDLFQLYPREFYEKQLYLHLVPRKGVLLIQRGEKSFTILLPFSS